MNYIDAHIHFDQYKAKDRNMILANPKLQSLVTVSNNIASCEKNLLLSRKHQKVKPAFGYHPEQALPTEEEKAAIFQFIKDHKDDMVAIGEVGLPYYLEKEGKVVKKEPYIQLLEQFILQAKQLNKPIVLHSIYEDAPLTCELLEKHNVKKAHFHWFKGDEKSLKRLEDNGYYISITPDIVYKERTQQLVKDYPLTLLMVETDGPWPFEGPIKGQLTTPLLIENILKRISEIKMVPLEVVERQIMNNTNNFYKI